MNLKYLLKKINILIFLFCGILLHTISLAQGDYVQISGVVTNSTGEPVNQTKIELHSHSSNDTIVTYTDSQGLYSIKVTLNETGVTSGKPATRYDLMQNFPNPFNPATNIFFSLPKASYTNITVYNTTGQFIKKLIEGYYPTGEHQTIWAGRDENGRGVSAGVYFYRIEAEDFSMTKKMLLLDGNNTSGIFNNAVFPERIAKPKNQWSNMFTLKAQKIGFDPFVEDFEISLSDEFITRDIVLNQVQEVFPLSVGNSWTFGFKYSNSSNEREVTFTIVDSIEIGQKLYYEFDHYPIFLPNVPFYDPLVRTCDQGDVFMNFDGHEILVYKFTDLTLDSLRIERIDSLPDYPKGVDLLTDLQSINDSVITKVGTFNNCDKFYASVGQIRDSNFWVWFSHGVGPVRFKTINVEADFYLKTATINGQKYP